MGPLSDREIEAELATTGGWKRDGDAITRKVGCGDFVNALLALEPPSTGLTTTWASLKVGM
ncbi:MAG: hypothetical protein QF652_02640 [Dehalococcoidia bacterium]|jgi:pterin-4a-carbinolamine dehydratase|nr:hypothetical protein [Dehalococcoidia bacterium]